MFQLIKKGLWIILIVLIVVLVLGYFSTRKIYRQIEIWQDDISYLHVELSLYIINKNLPLPNNNNDLQLIEKELQTTFPKNVILKNGLYLKKNEDSIYLYCKGNNKIRDRGSSKFSYLDETNNFKVIPKPIYNINRWFGTDDFLVAKYSNLNLYK